MSALRILDIRELGLPVSEPYLSLCMAFGECL